MKKKVLSLAVAAGLSGVMAGAAHAAMHVNDKGLGEALVYPFYSVEGGNDTYIHVVNTTDYTKAVKVRFIEAHNSAEVLDFNLYLSPQDVWAGAITVTANGGAAIRTSDTSCTVPDLGQTRGNAPFQNIGSKTVHEDGSVTREQQFVNWGYAYSDNLPSNDTDKSIVRTAQGYVEIIEMGQLDPEDGGYGAAAVHDADGIPNDRAGNASNACVSLVDAWKTAPQGTWTQQAAGQAGTGDTDLLPWGGEDGDAAGGLWGYGVVINVAEGTAFSYDAVAIDDFRFEEETTNLHFAPGSNYPSLENADTVATIFDGATATDYSFSNGSDAVSALFMSSYIHNDYQVDPLLNATTDWVVTMPTKRFYVNQTPALPPFSEHWNGTEACEPVAVSHWDREEAYVPPEDTSGFSPRPPQSSGSDNELCTEVSLVQFGDTSALHGNKIVYGFDTSYTEGWARMSFLPSDLVGSISSTARQLTAEEGVFRGLPVIGFAAIKYQNLQPVPGSTFGANYGVTVTHKSEQLIDSVD